MENVTEYTLDGLCCANCAAVIEDKIKKLPWVQEAQVNLATQVLSLKGKRDDGELEDDIQSLVDSVEEGISVSLRGGAPSGGKSVRHDYKAALVRRIPELIGALIFGVLVIPGPGSLISSYGRIILFALSYLLIGRSVLIAGGKNMIRGRVLDENFLMIVATAGAFAIGEYPEAAAVMLFYQIGEFFQDLAVDHSRRSIRNLMDSQPGTVLLVKEGTTEEIPAEKLVPGDRFRLRPGDRIPVDARILKGEGTMDTAALTGESYPRRVAVGDEVLSGFVNGDSLLEAEALKLLSESSYARIMRMVEDSSGRKARTEQFITRFARYYTPAVLFLALLLAVLPPLLIENARFDEWIYRALVFLVVSCPCALVVSIPLGFFAGIGRASREGILVKGGNYLEALNRVDSFFLDKTGTLTKGRFSLTGFRPAEGVGHDVLLSAAAAAESGSTHPIAESIVGAWSEEHPGARVPEGESQKAWSGKGVSAVWNGEEIYLGKAEWLSELGYAPPHLDAGGYTQVHVVRGGSYLGALLLGDELKEGVASSLNALKHDGVKSLVMLSGDGGESVASVAAGLPLDRALGDLLPEDKVRLLEEAARAGAKTAFVGDGINDAPVLARADVGIAMGGLGSDAAIEAADVVLLSDDPARLATARRIARKTRAIVIQNIVLALGIKGMILLAAAAGYAGMGLAVFGDVGVALLAVMNVLRILSDREPTSPTLYAAVPRRT